MVEKAEARRKLIEQPLSYDPSWHLVEEFFSARWFWRRWVIQEVVVASSVTVLWGHKRISWNIVGEAANWLKANCPPE